ncbi:MAG: hypothetical protein V9E96_00140 [Chitinophagaceae bacterium]
MNQLKLIRPFIEKDGVKYFSIEDIAAMKMHTICGRGKRKYFFDMYALIEIVWLVENAWMV